MPPELRLHPDDRSRIVLEARGLELRHHLALLEPPQVPPLVLGGARAHVRGNVAELLACLDARQGGFDGGLIGAQDVRGSALQGDQDSRRPWVWVLGGFGAS